MRGLLVSQDPENICKGLEERDDTSLTFFVIFFKKRSNYFIDLQKLISANIIDQIYDLFGLLKVFGEIQ